MKKTTCIIEVIIVFLLLKLFSLWLDYVLVRSGANSGWRTFLFGLQGIVIPLAIIALSKRKWSDYGFSFKNKKQLVHYGFIGAMLMLLLGLGFGYLKSQGISTSGRTGSLILSSIAILMTLLFVFFSRNKKQEKADKKKIRIRVIYQLAILSVMLICPIIVSIIRGGDVTGIIAWDFYFLVMVGFGEEIKFRGYFQSRINEEYGHPWKFFGLSFGPGLIIVSLLFGLSHIAQFGVFNPFLGQYHLNPWMGLQATLGGFFYGIIREKSKSIISSGIAHGVPNAFGQVLAMALK